MDENKKVRELSKEEQDVLLNEAQKLGVKGILTAFKVSTLKQKITEAKAQQNTSTPENKSTENTTPEVNHQDNSNTAVEEIQLVGEQFDISDEELEKVHVISKEEVKKLSPEIKYDGICHICMQKVFNGKCSGCGRE